MAIGLEFGHRYLYSMEKYLETKKFYSWLAVNDKFYKWIQFKSYVRELYYTHIRHVIVIFSRQLRTAKYRNNIFVVFNDLNVSWKMPFRSYGKYIVLFWCRVYRRKYQSPCVNVGSIRLCTSIYFDLLHIILIIIVVLKNTYT